MYDKLKYINLMCDNIIVFYVMFTEINSLTFENNMV